MDDKKQHHISRYINYKALFYTTSLFFSSFFVHARVETAEQALENLSGLTGREFIGLLAKDKGDEAWRLITTLVKKLQQGESFSMPCMAESAENMRSKFKQLLDENNLLNEGDRTGLSCFIEQLDLLKAQDYPYRESITASFLFSDLLLLVYRKQGLIQEESRYPKVPLELSVKQYWQSLQTDYYKAVNKLAKYMNLPSFALSEQVLQFDSIKYPLSHLARDSSGGEGLCHFLEYGSFSGFCSSLIFSENKDRIFYPTFAEFSVDDMNFLHHLPVVPIGFTTKPSEYHDSEDMDCRYLPGHDIDHEMSEVHSGLEKTLDKQEARKGKHKAIQKIYCHLRQAGKDPAFCQAVGLLLFETLHEGQINEHHSLDNLPCLQMLAFMASLIGNYKLGAGKKYQDIKQLPNLSKQLPLAASWLHCFGGHQYAGGNIEMIDLLEVDEQFYQVQNK